MSKEFKQAVKTYNNIMFTLCREYLTIGTRLSEDTDNWNLRDMVSEMAYQLHVLTSPNYAEFVDAHDENQPTIKIGNRIVGEYLYEWQKQVARMKRFINKYEPLSKDIKCTTAHASDYD